MTHGSTFSNHALKKVVGNFPARSLKKFFSAGCIPYMGMNELSPGFYF
jgi:hypothetical protein